MDAAFAVLDRLTESGTPVASLTVTPEELLVETPPDVTPPDGIAALRAIEDDPAQPPVIVRRTPGYVDLSAWVSRRRVRVRIQRRDT